MVAPAGVAPDDLTDVDRVLDYELFICACHCIGDGIAFHQFANDFFGLLGGASSQEELDQLVSNEWKQRWEQTLPSDVRFHNIVIHPTGRKLS